MWPLPALSQGLKVYAAGSLTAAFNEMAKAFGGAVDPVVYGPSGLLRQRIEKGERADILASADMAQPRALAKAGQPVILFTRNKLCALGPERLGLTPDNMLDRMLDPKVRLATSTPHADPAGDYARAIFAKAEALRPGARAALEAKALQLVGGPDTPPLVAGRGAVQGIFLANRADMFLGYCSGSESVRKEVPAAARLRSGGDRRALSRPGQLRLIASGPGAWQVGISSIRLTFMCGGSATTQAAASAMSSAVNGTVPA